MMVHPYQDYQKLSQNIMTFRACVQLPIDVDGINSIIDTQIMKTPHIILFHLVDLDNGKNPYIGTLKKERIEIFS